MIADKDTNYVYLSNLLEESCPKEFQQLIQWFDKLEINHGILPNTNDLWVVDFMPLQIREDYFLQYKYDPDYLKPKNQQATKTDPSLVCTEIGIVPNCVTM